MLLHHCQLKKGQSQKVGLAESPLPNAMSWVHHRTNSVQGFCNLKTDILYKASTSATKDEDLLLHRSPFTCPFLGHPSISPQQTLTELFKHSSHLRFHHLLRLYCYSTTSG